MPADERPPASSDLSGWSPDSGLGLDQATELLATGELTVVGRLPWSSNLTFLVSVDAGSDDPVGAVYKPGRGERSLWDFPDRLYRREVAAFALSEALGWGLVPPTVIREDGPLGEGSLQLFVDADFSQHYFTLFEEGGHEQALRTVCAFDVVANNADRKSGHVLRGPDDRLWGIDHGLCFHRQHQAAHGDLGLRRGAGGRRPPGGPGHGGRVPPRRDGAPAVRPGDGRPRAPDRRPGGHGHLPDPVGRPPALPWPLV